MSNVITDPFLIEQYHYKDLFLKNRIETASYKCLAEDREEETNLIRAEKAKLEKQISELKKRIPVSVKWADTKKITNLERKITSLEAEK